MHFSRLEALGDGVMTLYMADYLCGRQRGSEGR